MLLLNACGDPRVPLSRGTAMSLADMRLDEMGLDWGTARAAISPSVPDADGQQFWCVRYSLGPNREQRIVFVNEVTHWAHVRSGIDNGVDDAADKQIEVYPLDHVGDQPAGVLESSAYPAGPYIVILHSGRTQMPHSEVTRLNALALETGLIPNFSLRYLAHDTWQLVYGWNGKHGIQKMEAVSDWITLRTDYQESMWLNLLGE